MSRDFFGTDGVRGRVNEPPMTPETALRIGMAAGRYFRGGGHQHKIIIGKDTRLSGYVFEPALAAGLLATGVDVIMLGPVPTPAVGILTKSFRADAGIMLTASHNAFTDNGIKFFGPDGYKLSDAEERQIEAMMSTDLSEGLSAAEQTGRAERLQGVGGRYVEFAKATVPTGFVLDGLKIVIDCAHGAAYKVAPTILRELGAEVVAIGIEPNGTNINAGVGSTHPQSMTDKVREVEADLGIALDGDADRLVIADEQGQLVGGDQLLALAATAWQRRGTLIGGGIVTSVMSNLGLERFLETNGLSLKRCRVGDRYVGEAMRAEGFNIGGEQSGHIIFSDFATTGDGLIAALQVMVELVSDGGRASQVFSLFEPLPQVTKSAGYTAADPMADQAVQSAITEGEATLSNGGRLLVRRSGTEAVVRVMAEGEDEALIGRVVSEICTAVESAS
jgi:phosphoglucosamine mutase